MSETEKYVSRDDMNKLLRSVIVSLPNGGMTESEIMKAADAIPSAEVEAVKKTYKLGDIVEVNTLGEPEYTGLILMVIAQVSDDLYLLANEKMLHWFRKFNLTLLSESKFFEVKNNVC